MTGITQASAKQWMAKASIEIVPPGFMKLTNPQDYLYNNEYVYVTYLPNHSHDSVVNASKAVIEAGARPVAHIGARHIKNLEHLKQYVDSLHQAKVKDVLLLAGDRAQPLGDYHSSIDLIKTGLFDDTFESVGFAAHPGGHPNVNHARLMEAVEAKNQWASDKKSNVYFLTQFVFDANMVIKWIKQDLVNNHLPVYVGLPGLAKPKTLLKFASSAGIGWGRIVAMFLQHPMQWLKFSTKWSPEKQIEVLGKYQLRHQNNCPIKGLHFYTFGAFKSTSNWIKSYQSHKKAEDPRPQSESTNEEGRRYESAK